MIKNTHNTNSAKIQCPNFFNEGLITIIMTIVMGCGFYLFPDSCDIQTKIIVCIIIAIIFIITIVILLYIKINKFYNNYSNQYEYFITKTKEIAKLQKQINEIQKNQLEYEIIDTWKD